MLHFPALFHFHFIFQGFEFSFIISFALHVSYYSCKVLQNADGENVVSNIFASPIQSSVLFRTDFLPTNFFRACFTFVFLVLLNVSFFECDARTFFSFWSDRIKQKDFICFTWFYFSISLKCQPWSSIRIWILNSKKNSTWPAWGWFLSSENS